jgi:hypothetical protein
MRRIGVTEEVARQASTMASAGAEEEVKKCSNRLCVRGFTGSAVQHCTHSQVLVSVEAGLGRLVLNRWGHSWPAQNQRRFCHLPGCLQLCRPRNLNALTHNMVACLKDVLLEWAQPSSGVGCVVIKGAGGKVCGQPLLSGWLASGDLLTMAQPLVLTVPMAAGILCRG